MIPVDNVYQTVLAAANKEQRGYITPQEFNLMANKAQLEIFDSYFHDIKTAYHKRKNQMGSGFDDIEMIQEKLQPFCETANWIQAINDHLIDLSTETSTGGIPISSHLYMIDTLEKVHLVPGGFSVGTTNTEANNATSTLDDLQLTEVTEMSNKEVAYSQGHPLTAATQLRPVYVRDTNSQLRIYPTPNIAMTFILKYWRKPVAPSWGYVVVQEKALYNSNTAVNFELHTSEEERLVTRILQLAGIIIKNPSIQQAAMIDGQSTHQSQNN